MKHECYCKQDELHVENPRRLLAIYEQLKQTRLLDDCEIIRGYYATIEMLTECHKYVDEENHDFFSSLINQYINKDNVSIRIWILLYPSLTESKIGIENQSKVKTSKKSDIFFNTT